MGVPVFGKTVGFADFAAATVAVGAVLTFDERRVDFAAATRRGNRRLHLLIRAENRPIRDFFHAAFHPFFVNGRVDQSRLRTPSRASRPTAFPGAARLAFFAERFEDRLFIRLVLVAGDKPRTPVFQAFRRFSHQTPCVFNRPFAADDLQHEFILGVQRHVVPAVAATGVGRVRVVTVFLFFFDEFPLFVELNFLGFRGKNRPIRREVFRYIPRRVSSNGSPCRD